MIIESAIFDNENERCSASFETKVYSKYGDADVMTSRYKYIDATLIFFYGFPLMITSNTNLEKDLGNGTRIIGLSFQLKKDCLVNCKTWDVRLIHTVSCLDVEYMVCETIPSNKSENQRNLSL